MLFHRNEKIHAFASRPSMFSSVSARTIIVAAFAAGLSSGASYAADCGSPPTVTCTGPEYLSGITYTGVDALTLNLPDGVSVNDGVTITTANNASGLVLVNVDTGTGVLVSPTGVIVPFDQNPGAVRIEAAPGTTGNLAISMTSGTVQNNGEYTSGLIVATSDVTPSSDMRVDLSGGSITISGTASSGITVANQGTGSSVINMTGGTISDTATPGATGLAGVQTTTGFNTTAAEQNVIDLSGGSITIHSDASHGALAVSTGQNDAAINLTGTTIATTGQGSAQDVAQHNGSSAAVAAQSSGGGSALVTMNAGSVSTEGDNAFALASIIIGTDTLTGTAQVSANGGPVSTKGANSPAVYIYNNASGASNAIVHGGVISTEGDGSDGVYVVANHLGAASVNMPGGSVTTTGNNSAGLVAEIAAVQNHNDAKVNLAGGTVTTGSSTDPTLGTGSHGLYATSASYTGQAYAFATQDLVPTMIQTYGASAHGIFAEATRTGTAYAGMQGGTINTAGDGSYGIAATATTGDVETDYYWGDIATAGAGSHGVYAETGGPGKVSMIIQNYEVQGQQLTTSGAGAHGVYAVSASGAIDLSVYQGKIATSGAGSYGVAAEIQGTGSQSDLTAQVAGIDISTQGAVSHGLYLKNYGRGNVIGTFSGEEVNGSSASTATDGSHGIYLEASQGGTAQFTGDVTRVDTSGSGAHAIYVTNQDTGAAGNASISYQSGHITTAGSGAYGLYAEALGSGTADVTTSGNGFASTIDISGSGAYGVSAYSQGNITTLSLDAMTITASGNAQAAVGFAERWSAGQAATQANIVFGSNLVIDASGAAGSHAFYNADDQAGTNMSLTTWGTVTGSSMMGGGNSTFTLAGGSYTGDIYGDFDPSETPATNQGTDAFIWSGGTLHSGFYGQGGNDTALIAVADSPSFPAAIMDGGEDGGAPESRISSDIDQITFAASNGSLAGHNITNWEQFTVNQDVALGFVDDGLALDGYDGGNANGLGDFNMMGGSSVLAGAGLGQTFTLSGNVLNQGTLSMQDGAFGGNFIVGGDYTSKQGRLAIDVDFGALKSDVLSLGGAVGGLTQIDIADVGTTGSVGSILIVDMTNASQVDQNEFAIEAESSNMTASGIYAYSLQYNLNSDPGNGLAPGLYLTSLGRNGPINPVPPVPPAPVVQPYVPLYEGYQSVLLEMNTVSTLRQRVGNRYWVYDAPMAAPVNLKNAPEDTPPQVRPNEETPALQNVWGRMGGDYAHFDPTSSTYDYNYDLSQFELQTGVDGLFLDNGYGRLIAGLTGHYRVGEAKFSSIYGDSKVHPEGWGLGGTITWYGDNGFYADGQAEATWYNSELKAEDLQKGVDNSNSFGYAVSMEAGKKIGFGNDLVVTPQGQLVWSAVNVDSFTGAYNDDVDFNDGHSLTGRLGVALERERDWYEQSGLARHSNIYGLANLYYGFNNSVKTTLEQVYVAESELNDWTGEIGLGGTYDWQDYNKVNYAVYGEVSASMGFDSGSYGYGGNVGFRVKW